MDAPRGDGHARRRRQPGARRARRHPETTRLGAYLVDVPLAFRADALGVLFALLASALWLATSVYSVGYVRALDEHAQARYFAAFAASIAASLGVALAANLLTLFVAYELLTVATYPLVVHAETDEARRAGRTYLAYTFAGGVAVFAGIVLVAVVAGDVGFTPAGSARSPPPTRWSPGPPSPCSSSGSA
ncbi:proton-conducting transporter membrane subunit [Halobacteriaceae archaeon GCM10025711]